MLYGEEYLLKIIRTDGNDPVKSYKFADVVVSEEPVWTRADQLEDERRRHEATPRFRLKKWLKASWEQRKTAVRLWIIAHRGRDYDSAIYR